YILKQVIFLKIIAFIALLAGGINIMNIMLVSVKERTRELGIRMALGARFKDIILQFLAEALFLCFLGGAAGIILSMPLTLFMAKMFLDNTPVKFSLNMIAIAFIYSSIIGIIFGIYPARCAALKDPIESLRYE
ncbi:MAG: FtsX-like permease family protein, partial [Armatimonadetes bacterium]|nr:FtsX-like permease family protein [Armatimonadota bacterium]